MGFDSEKKIEKKKEHLGRKCMCWRASFSLLPYEVYKPNYSLIICSTVKFYSLLIIIVELTGCDLLFCVLRVFSIFKIVFRMYLIFSVILLLMKQIIFDYFLKKCSTISKSSETTRAMSTARDISSEPHTETETGGQCKFWWNS